ncbi:peptidoglycan DD-metalloendopeptidase family protein [Burkholderia sp. BCC1977]|uniref:peptidoglycan DD-metalloendopeptidase family protein n=1 Tax=Burkholderia sp. BCC1977 TaxID=2817440 RepID=UPI002ABE2196|nr:peptidoglycan DD-metalloendopeptidase family protein [Burkholderia sp. BCC1977]
MVISPPFLPSQPSGTGHEIDSASAGNTVVPDHDICQSGMQECAPGNGAYPVSYSLGWHGGPHLVAPEAANGRSEPVRAIADGEVVYVRQTDASEKPTLQYRNVRTDDGCVVIKHTTEIGEGDSAKVTFYSIYMHLQSVTVKLGKPVYRKDLLGMPGQIYGQRGQIHFEIVCDTANLKKLVGRTTGPLAAMQGRTDAIYGDIWFKVPKGLKFFANRPHPYRRDDTEPPQGPHPSVQTQPAAGTTEVDLLVQMHYERGDCTLTTFTLTSDGRCVRVGEPVITHGYEYSLYAEAMRLNGQYHDGSTNPAAPAPAAPAPSLIYEMLRLGRAVGEPMPGNVKFGHWRKIATPDGTGWINLNAPKKEGHYGATPYAGISVYSDADFPHWAGWSLIDDDTTPDSLCESPTIKRWLDLDRDGQVTHAEAKEALHNRDVRKRMAQAICKFPIEWAKQDIDTRWGWLKSPHEALATPLTGEDFHTLTAHIEALAFWEDIQTPDLPRADDCWHFPPKAFIEHLRRCKWLSESEFRQLVPKYAMRKHNGTMLWEPVTNPYSIALGTLPRRQLVPINRMLRTFGINTPQRMASFFGNAIQETQWLTKLAEGAMTARYAPWDGRGFLQLTWPKNYLDYWDFRGRSTQIPARARASLLTAQQQADATRNNAPLRAADHQLTPDMLSWRDDVSDSTKVDAAWSAGFYWTSLNMVSHADELHVLERVIVATNGGQKCYYRSPSFWKASAAVNLPGAIGDLYSARLNGFEARCAAYAVALSVLGETKFPAQGQPGETPENQILRRA